MDLETAFYSLLQQELGDRYERLCARLGTERVVAPSTSLIEAFADVTHAARADGGGDAVRDCVRYAGETYEYIMERWQDPRWRVIVSIAFQMDLGHRPAPEPARRTTTRRHRSAGYFANVLADALI